MLKIGIVGCGAIGTQLARAITARAVAGTKLQGIHDVSAERARRLSAALQPHTKICTLAELAQSADLLIEAAGMPAVPVVAAAALAAKKDLLVMSVGALLEPPDWVGRFHRAGCRLHYPSGAVAGLDGLKAAAMQNGLRRVTLITRKPPRGLAGAPYFQKHRLDPKTLTQAQVIFSGTARQAVRLFPQNINVAAAVSLAGLGPDRTRVQIVADPQARRNSHTLVAEGAFGKLTATTENRPSPDNPKTSLLAGQSALALLASLVQAK